MAGRAGAGWICACMLTLLLTVPAPGAGQSITRGTLEGTVTDATGKALIGANIWITDSESGATWRLRSDRAGRFRLALLSPGDYDVLVEELGYQPQRISGVPVRPGANRRLEVTLSTTTLPVSQIEAGPAPRAVADSRAGVSQWFAPFEVSRLPENRREFSELGRLSTTSDINLATEGLPSSLSEIAVDGVPYSPARHRDLAVDPGAFVFPRSTLHSAELVTNGLDVEWSEAAGAYLSGYSTKGSDRPELRLLGDWQAGVLTTSDTFNGRDIGTHSFRGGAVFSGPIISDTAHVVLGLEAQRLETPLPQPWEIDTLDAALVGVASGFGVNIAPYTSPRVATTDLLSGYSRFDWQLASAHAISVRGNIASIRAGGNEKRDPDLGPDHAASLGAELEGLDLAGAATLASRFSNLLSQELRVGVDFSERDYKQTGPPMTRIVDGGQAFGNDPTLPAKFERLTVRASETLHFSLPRHQLKLGIAGLYTSDEQRYAYARAGEYIFGGVGEFDRLEGVYSGATGAAPVAKFRNWQLAAYLQDVWTAVPGLDVLLGLRYEYEVLDSDAIRRNEDWREITGIDNAGIEDKIHKFSPRFGFLWDVSQRGVWFIRGGAAIYHDRVDAGVFGEAVAQDGPVEFQRGVGTLGSWPLLPSLAQAPLQGTRLSLLGPDFQPPRTGRISLGFTRLLERGSALHLSGVYRYTDHLPRRADLNLPLAPTGRDQYGRPIYGNLVQSGSLIAAEPGSNRRFTDFDLVSALNADGVSSFWGFTVTLERHANDWLDLLASYTYSWTDDDWLSGSGGGPDVQLTPFPDSLAGVDWADGRSDFDVPHRLVLGTEWKLRSPLQGLRLAAFYRFQTGQPFTPGFRDGVDANGDGSARNDPAFVDPAITGMDALLQEWDCLADQAGEFVERNSCRGPDTHRLDARLALGVVNFSGHPVELGVDLLNALDTDTGLRDRALYLIDRNATIATDPDGTVTLPLVVNPRFGEALVRRTSGRSLRLGLRVGL
ncbi:MAG: TonB-dependent receptor [Gemmatimonadota bacterium]|nr:MAG: TonB-dependent receptor [Gemmatimonadota bacterium]